MRWNLFLGVFYSVLSFPITEWYNQTYSYWPFEFETGFWNDRIARDWRGTNNGKIKGAVRPIPGVVGTAIHLYGNTSSIDFGLLPGTCFNDPMSCTNGFAITFWLRIPNFQGNKIIIQMAKNRNSRGLTVWTRRQKNKKLNFSVNGKNRKYRLEANWTYEYWTHVSIVWSRDPDALKVYFNCTLNKIVENPETPSKKSSIGTVKMMFGASQGNKKHSRVQLDELAIWNRTIKPEEICGIVRIRTVHGGYSEWSKFSECSQTCGNATKIRTRNCTNPAPKHRGRDCSHLGPDHEIQHCKMLHCPVHGGYEWTTFSRCTQSCGTGKQYRNQKCTNPKPAYGGKGCSPPPLKETRDCNTNPCPVDGKFTEWSDYSNCTKSCENGTKFRYRNCTNPAPQHGGRECQGPTLEVIECNTHKCPIDGGFTQWSNFTECSKSCGNGTKFRYRNCTNPIPNFNGKNCVDYLGPANETISCNTHHCPIDGGFTNWTKFSNCSKSCGNGTRFRYRNCTNPSPQHGGKNCSGKNYIVELCNTHICPIDGGYTAWTNFTECTVSCGNGTKSRHRNCTNPIPMYNGKDCSLLGPAQETQLCNTYHCPIHGQYTQWSQFTNCSKLCGNGTKYRFRSCTNPVPQYGGNNCSEFGDNLTIAACNTHECPIHGGFSPWSNFTECSKSCGNGTKYRTRNCTNPAPKHGGRNCSGPLNETLFCNSFPCPIDGGYTEWTDFSNCTKPCGNGTRFRTRECTNPPPRHGGKECSILGAEIETTFCNTHFCPINGGYTEWSSYSECSKTCGYGEKVRLRHCTNPIPQHGGEDCSSLGAPKQEKECRERECPVHGGYSPWSPFGKCSKTCGSGTKTRTRTCTNPVPKHGGKPCTHLGSNYEIRNCNRHPCPINGRYTPWSFFNKCSKSCGSGVQSRHRTCTNPAPQFGGQNCSRFGPSIETRTCNTKFCPIHGNYSKWSNFTSCSKSCGSGVQSRHRTCTNPAPQFGGQNCSSFGSSIETRTCNTNFCPVHGNYSEWSNFITCSKSCGSGVQSRYRTCTNPAPKFGGQNCSRFGPSNETRTCNTNFCPIHGNYSKWSNFTSCSKSCGNGTLFRRRICNNPVPKHGGNNCSHLGPAMDIRQCNVFPCPIDGRYTSWSYFSTCDKSCSNGTKFRTRNCSNPSPQYGGRNCSKIGPPIEIVSCFVRHCPIHGQFGNWSEYGPCSKSCNIGIKNRTRVCDSPKPKYGGRACEGASMQTTVCNVHPCPIHGNYTAWSEFSPCSTSCDGGFKIKTRNCTNPEPMHGGRNCSQLGESIFSEKCNTQRCPDIVFNITLNLTRQTWRESLASPSSEAFKSLKYSIQSQVSKSLSYDSLALHLFDLYFKKRSYYIDKPTHYK